MLVLPPHLFERVALLELPHHLLGRLDGHGLYPCLCCDGAGRGVPLTLLLLLLLLSLLLLLLRALLVVLRIQLLRLIMVVPDFFSIYVRVSTLIVQGRRRLGLCTGGRRSRLADV